MICPPAKKLAETFKISAKSANLIRRIARAAEDGDSLESVIGKCCPDTRSYVDRLSNDPYRNSHWRTVVALHAINDLVGGHGIEALGRREYINMGDPYVETLIYTPGSDRLSIGNWGYYAERGEG